MDTMSIAALSVGMSQQQTYQDLGVSVLKMAMQESTGNVEELLEALPQSVDPNLGQNIDILA